MIQYYGVWTMEYFIWLFQMFCWLHFIAVIFDDPISPLIFHYHKYVHRTYKKYVCLQSIAKTATIKILGIQPAWVLTQFLHWRASSWITCHSSYINIKFIALYLGTNLPIDIDERNMFSDKITVDRNFAKEKTSLFLWVFPIRYCNCI